MSSTNHDHARAAFGALAQARVRFGRARLEMGIYLEQIRRSEAWRLRSDTFARFLEEERVNESAAYQYMRVARRFAFELPVDDATMAELAMVSMSILDQAAKIVTAENLDEILAVVTTLSERDALVALDEIAQQQNPSSQPAQRREPRVAKVLRLYRELADDERIDVRNVLRMPAGAAR